MSSYTLRHTFATLPRTERGTPFVLGKDPKSLHFIYGHGNSVVIRNFKNPEYSDIYTQHSCSVLVAKYSPSGFYIASADKSGKIRIWDTVNSEHILKNEYQPICGPIKDIAWSSDNQRIVVVGEGREKFGHVFLAETGTSNGDITGQTRPVNSCDFKPTRPFRIITGSEDNTSAFYEGPPFKFSGTKKEHSRYVQCVRYSPNGNYWASGGFDGKIFVYEGKDSKLCFELKESEEKSAHEGGVYALAWSPDSTQLLSASGDKSCKVWSIETQKMSALFKMGDSVEDQQLGCLWNTENELLSVSLSGYLNYLDLNKPGAPVRVISGHCKPITSLEVVENEIYTADSEGRVIQWNAVNGSCVRIIGQGHKTQISYLRKRSDSSFFSIGMDDTLRGFSQGSFTYEVSLKGQPRGGISHGHLDLIITVNSLLLFIIENIIQKEETLSYEPTTLSSSIHGSHVAIGDTLFKIHIYLLNETNLTLNELSVLSLSGCPTDLSYSPSGKYLVASDTNRKVTLFNAESSYDKAHGEEWVFHTAKVNCVSWSPNEKLIASGGLDTAIIIWSVENPSKHLIIRSAHLQSQINGIKWLNESSLVSIGQDSNIKIWDIDFRD